MLYKNLADARRQLTPDSTVLVVDLLHAPLTHRGQVVQNESAAFTLATAEYPAGITFAWPPAALFDAATGTMFEHQPDRAGAPTRVARYLVKVLARAYVPLLFDFSIEPGPAYVHHAGVEPPPYRPSSFPSLPSSTPKQHQDLHALAHLAHLAGFRLVLARLSADFPLLLTTFRYGQTRSESYTQWGDAYLPAGERLRIYLEAALRRQRGDPPAVLA